MSSRLATSLETTYTGSRLLAEHTLIPRTIPHRRIQPIDVGANQLDIVAPDGAVLVQPNFKAVL